MTPAQIHAFLSDLNAALIKHGVEIVLAHDYDSARLELRACAAPRGLIAISILMSTYGEPEVEDGTRCELVAPPEAVCPKCDGTWVARKIGELCYRCNVPIVAYGATP